MKRNVIKTALFLIFPAVFFPFSYSAAQNCKSSIIASTPDESFTILDDGTAVNNTTGLMWMRCSLGQTPEKYTCSGQAALLSWSDGLKAAADYEFAGHTDWRLPNKNELESLVENRCALPAINAAVFPATPSAYFWSSSPYAPVAHGAWSVDFGYGAVNASVKSGVINVRLVRDKETRQMYAPAPSSEGIKP